MSKAKLDWTSIDIPNSAKPVKDAMDAFMAAKTKLETTVAAALTKKGVVPDGHAVKVLANSAWGTVSYAFAPQSGGSAKVAL
jgi:hypothetical protein